VPPHNVELENKSNIGFFSLKRGMPNLSRLNLAQKVHNGSILNAEIDPDGPGYKPKI